MTRMRIEPLHCISYIGLRLYIIASSVPDECPVSVEALNLPPVYEPPLQRPVSSAQIPLQRLVPSRAVIVGRRGVFEIVV